MVDSYRYAVIGAGMQGTAEAYDLAGFGNASHIILADISEDIALKSAERVNRLVNRDVVSGIALNATDFQSVCALLEDIDVCCGAAHYNLNLTLTKAAIEVGCHFCDLGGNNDVVQQQYELSKMAKKKHVAVVPDCGLAPGMGNILAARALRKMTCESIQIRCGGLPKTPHPPLDYQLVFSIAGLTNEYTGKCIEIRDGKIVELSAFTEKEDIEFSPPVGQCEAFLTSGGTSTGATSFQGQVKNYGYKTVRYPGHFDKMKTMIDLGFLNEEPIEMHGHKVVPREFFHEMVASHLYFPEEEDLVVLRVTADGADEQQNPIRMTQDLMEFHDKATGFSAMERTTAYSATIVAVMLAENDLPAGVHAQEKVVDPDRFVSELNRRNIKILTRQQESG